MFGDKLKLSCVAVVPQEYLWLRLILNLPENLNEGTPSFNGATEREVTPDSVQFGHAFPHILQTIWKADPDKGPVQVSKSGRDVCLPLRNDPAVPG